MTLFCTKGFNFNEIFQISRDYETENVHIGKIFGKICLKAITDTFFQWSAIKRGDGVKHERKGEDSIFWWGGSESSRVPPLVASLSSLSFIVA